MNKNFKTLNQKILFFNCNLLKREPFMTKLEKYHSNYNLSTKPLILYFHL